MSYLADTCTRRGRSMLSALVVGLVISLVSAAVPAVATATPASGSLNVLENAGFEGSWPGLDPATDTSDAADINYLDAIYGDLFEQGAQGRILPDLATGYSFSDGGLTLDIRLRPDVHFSDGTPFDAQAVVFNIKRDLEAQYGCLCDSSFPVASVIASGPLTVAMHLTRVFAPIVAAFIGNAPNWIVSPTALAKLGESAFALNPVGAGPFEVLSDEPGAVLQLARNPGYWQQGRPYLNRLTFTAVGSDESAYQAIVAGKAQAYQDLSSANLVAPARKVVTVTTMPAALGPFVVQFNTRLAPLDNLVAREALYYATDPAAINLAAEGGRGTLSQSPSGPGDLFYFPTVAGYRTYDLALAQAMVKQMGGLAISLITSSAGPGVAIANALRSQWAQAGIQTILLAQPLPALIQTFQTHNFQAILQTAGGYDTAIGNGMALRYASNAPFTGVHDPALDQLIDAGVATSKTAARRAIYGDIAQYLSEKAYSPFLFSLPTFNLTAPGVSGPGLTTPTSFVQWQDVRTAG